MTGWQPSPQIIEQCETEYAAGLRASFKDEQNTTDFYLDIAEKSNDPYIKETFRRASADEQNHAVWFLYFLTANKSNNDHNRQPVTVVDYGATGALQASTCLDLAWEYAAGIQYAQHASMIKGAAYFAVAEELQEHSKDEFGHAIVLNELIQYLGGIPTTQVAPIYFNG